MQRPGAGSGQETPQSWVKDWVPALWSTLYILEAAVRGDSQAETYLFQAGAPAYLSSRAL